MRSFLLLASLVAYAAATGRPLGNRLAELVHQDPLNEEKIDKMLSLIDDAEEMNLSHPGNGMTALHALVDKHDRPDYVRKYVEKGSQVNAVDAFGRTPLIIAAQHAMVDSAKLLLELGADKNIVNKWGQKAADEARHGDNADYDLADYIEGARARRPPERARNSV
jgi:hypothetical protein